MSEEHFDKNNVKMFSTAEFLVNITMKVILPQFKVINCLLKFYWLEYLVYKIIPNSCGDILSVCRVRKRNMQSMEQYSFLWTV